MIDPLRYAIHLVLPVDRIDAEKLAAAIRAEIDLRADARLALMLALVDRPAKPQPAEPRDPNVLGDALEAMGLPRGEPRRNPYADWETWDNDNRIFTYRDMRRTRFVAWNEGAQIAGQRDE